MSSPYVTPRPSHYPSPPPPRLFSPYTTPPPPPPLANHYMDQYPGRVAAYTIISWAAPPCVVYEAELIMPAIGRMCWNIALIHSPSSLHTFISHPFPPFPCSWLSQCIYIYIDIERCRIFREYLYILNLNLL